MLDLIERWYGAQDHEIDPKTGRPKPPQSWLSARIQIWTGWFLAAGMSTMPFFYFRRWGADRWLLIMIVVIPLWALQNYVIMRSLKRKKAAMRDAIAAHDAGLAKAFAELEGDLSQAEAV